MRKFLVVAGFLALAFTARVNAQEGTLFTNAVLAVTPSRIDFGAVAPRTTVTNTFLVENVGSKQVKGKATVAAPFKIIEGASYVLTPNSAQVVTITYRPSRAEHDSAMVHFSGGYGARAAVIGRRAESKPER